MFRALDDSEARNLIRLTTVGRIGFVHDGTVQILPVNYIVDADGSLVIRTAGDSLVATLVARTGPVSFEVDFHDDDRGLAWSVLMHGEVDALADDAVALIPEERRPTPWAGGDRRIHLRFAPHTMTGRRVRHEER